MAKLLKLRRGTTTQHASFTGAEGEVTIDTTKDTAVVHDGSTQAGRPLAREDLNNVSSASITGRLGNGDIAGSKIADAAITLAKLEHGTSSNDGKFLRANNGADPTFETVNTDLSGDTSPQLGGELDTNGNDIVLKDNDKLKVGTGAEFVIWNDTQNLLIDQEQDGLVTYIRAKQNGTIKFDASDTGNQVAAQFKWSNDSTPVSSAELYAAGVKKFETTGTGVTVTGNIAVSGTVDGRDVAADGTKLDGIETGAKADQTGAEIKTAYEAESDTNAFTDALLSKLNAIEAQATADQTASDITTLLGDQNLYTTGNIGRDAGDYINFTTDTQMDVYVNGQNEFRFEADGDFHADGDVIAQSTTTASDRKLKENIEVIPNALDKVQALNGVSFDWKKTGEKSAGVIAQEVQAVLPEAVKEVTPVGGGDSHLTVNYHALTSILIESIKQLKEEIEELKGGK